MAKRVVLRPEWLDAPKVIDICAVSKCVSNDFCDYINYWKHNGFWFFDTPIDIRNVAFENGIDISDTTLFYYRGHPQQFDNDSNVWIDYSADADLPTNVLPPLDEKFLGFDVVTYSVQNAPECSPLSCNHLASKLHVNKHCLIESLDYAVDCIENGAFIYCEPGPFRIISVNSLRWPSVGVTKQSG